MSGKAVAGKNIGIIGVGNIGSAILRGLLHARRVGQICIYDIKRENLGPYTGESLPDSDSRVLLCASNTEVAERSDIIIVAVKPGEVYGVLEEIAPIITDEKVVVSVAAGIPTTVLERALGASKKVIRVMPNIGALVGASVTAVCRGTAADDEAEAGAKEIFEAIGTVYSVKERDLDAVTGLSGSGIAFFAAVIEAMADGGLHEGLPHDLALTIAAHTALGAATLILAGKDPAEIRYMTASPGGTTIRGLHVLDAQGVKGALIAAVIEATRRARELSGAPLSKEG
jgi:pyrroline-5-carboxylate reductase